MYPDSHLHSSFSSDSDTPMEEMIQMAISKGLSSMCFTEHMDFDFPPGEFDFLVDMDTYQQTLSCLSQKYQNQIKIRFGIELGLQAHLGNQLSDFINCYPFDFVIGSIHVVDKMDPYEPVFYENRSEEDAYMRYFSCVLENIKKYSCFDVCGHIDYVVRYGPNKNRYYSYKKYQDVIDEILRVLIDKNIGLECNTGGFKYGLGHPNPTEEILKRYREMGGEIITLGSDAHVPQYIAYEFQRAAEILRQCGFSYYTVFEKRKPVFLPL